MKVFRSRQVSILSRFCLKQPSLFQRKLSDPKDPQAGLYNPQHFLIYFPYSHILSEFPSKLKITAFFNVTPYSLAKCTNVSDNNFSETSAISTSVREVKDHRLRHPVVTAQGSQPPSSPDIVRLSLTFPVLLSSFLYFSLIYSPSFILSSCRFSSLLFLSFFRLRATFIYNFISLFYTSSSLISYIFLSPLPPVFSPCALLV